MTAHDDASAQPAGNADGKGRTSSPKLLKKLKSFTWGHVIFLSAMVGIVSGLGGVAFNFMVDTADRYAMAGAAGYVAPRPGAEGGGEPMHMPTRRWVLLAMPALGGLLAGLLVFTFAPEAEGHGTDAVVRAFHRGRGIIRARVPIIKTLASAITIGSGGSAGREGPIGQIGAGFGSALASWLRVGDRERRLLMLAGGGAGIGAVFRAPLGGALFIAEVLYQDIEFESAALVPAFVASIVAYSVYCSIYGTWGPIFDIPALRFNRPIRLPFYAILGVLSAAVGWLYVKVFYGVRDYVFAPMKRVPRHVKPMIGGLVVGLVGYFFPQALGMGYGWTQLAIHGALTVKVLALIVFLKIGLTAMTISSGGSGGVFGPSIVIGGCLGGLYGTLLHHLFPGIAPQPAPFVLVGMAGFFAGVAKAPIASLVMVSEMTEGYGLLVPLMLTTAVAYMLLPRRTTLYEEQLLSRTDSPAHEGEFTLDVLEGVRIAEVLEDAASPTTLAPGTPLREVLAAANGSSQKVFPIIDPDRGLVGVVTVDDLRIFLIEHALLPDLLVANDLRATEFRTAEPQEDLASALRKMYATGLDELPVLADDDPRRVTAMLTRRDIMSAYHERLHHNPEVGRAVPQSGHA